jgi:hypothetical protein
MSQMPIPKTERVCCPKWAKQFYRAGLFALAHWTLHSAWTICARVARKMRLLMLALCAVTISACGRLPATVPAGVDSREA